jgi:hypothetical protein
MKEKIVVTLKNEKVFNLFGKYKVIHKIMGDTPKWISCSNGTCTTGWDYSIRHFDTFMENISKHRVGKFTVTCEI